MGEINLRVDCGTDDAFYDNTKQLRASVRPEPAGGFAPGGHRMEYWTRMVPEQLAFLADSF